MGTLDITKGQIKLCGALASGALIGGLILGAIFATLWQQLAPQLTQWIQGGTLVGFDFREHIPESPAGDRAAPNHLFVHLYPMPARGIITRVTYLNDKDKVPETITLLILRPAGEGWRVIHRVTLTDDIPPATQGISTVTPVYPLSVEAGDVFAHWQSGDSPTGPIPLNLDSAAIEGHSMGKFGFQATDLQVGQLIVNTGFSGQRDYFINVILE